MFSVEWLMLSLLFSSIGLGYFVYGKKQRSAIPLITGLILIAYPYFVNNLWMLCGVGVVLIVLPYFIRI